MINTEDFRTKTEFIVRKNLSSNDSWGIALDIGYSAVKGMSPNSVYRFPSYARKIEGQLLNMGTAADTDIFYRDHEDGTIWAVGKAAQDMIKSDETKDSNASLYGRNRYFDPMFLVIARVGLALGMNNNSCGSPNNKKLVLQTGLPAEYVKADTDLIKEALAGSHTFDVKIGEGKWKTYQFTLSAGNISTMPQPMGTFISISTNNDGTSTTESKNYANGNILIFDPGFSTLDLFAVENRAIRGTETVDLGMKAVLQSTADRIFKEYGVEVRVPVMQKMLETGTFKKFDRKTRQSSEINFASILEEESAKICNIAMNKIDEMFNHFLDYDYLVITGGTGEAWAPFIRDYFGGIQSLKVIDGNINDDLSFVYSNVRGYYMYLAGKLRKTEGTK